MLRFFSQLRQGSSSDNRPRSYLLYALGEIVLVMIGILLALEVNNWNEDRKERKIEAETLKDLRVEFEENLADAERVLEGNLGIYQAMSHLQKAIRGEALDPAHTDSLLYATFDWFDYTPKPGASNNLINSGNLNLISNRELRKLLTLWPGIIDELDDDEQLAKGYSQQEIVPYLALHYPMSNLEQTDMGLALYRPDENGASPDIYIPEPVAFDAGNLLADPVFQNHLAVKKMYARHNAMECQKLVNACREILSLINEELALRKAEGTPDK